MYTVDSYNEELRQYSYLYLQNTIKCNHYHITNELINLGYGSGHIVCMEDRDSLTIVFCNVVKEFFGQVYQGEDEFQEIPINVTKYYHILVEYLSIESNKSVELEVVKELLKTIIDSCDVDPVVSEIVYHDDFRVVVVIDVDGVKKILTKTLRNI